MVCDDQRVELIIEGESIPTVNNGVTTEISSDAQKSGADITRLTEAFIPLSWKDENIVDGIESFDPASQSSYDRVTVRYQSVRNGGWDAVHRGFVRGVSGAESMNVGRVVISDPAALTTAIPFSQTYKKPTVSQIFNDVADTIREKSVFNPQPRGVISREMGGGGQTVNQTGDPVLGFISDASLGLLGEGSNLDGEVGDIGDTVNDVKAFKSNRHSVADALNWACDTVGGKWYFSFRAGNSSGLSLVYDDGSNTKTFVQRTGRGGAQPQRLNDQGSFPNASNTQLDIIENDSLAEIFPVNTLTLRGATGTSIFGWETTMVPSRRAPFVTVQYPPFVKAAGGNVVGKTIETDNVTLDSATNTAKKKLEQEILDSGTGEMKCYGNPYPKPYDRISAKPECADVVIGDMPTLPYEIAGVTHQKSAFEEMKTNISVCPVVSPSLIEVKEAEMREV